MTAWPLVAMFGTAALLLAVWLWRETRQWQRLSQKYEAEAERLRVENGKLMASAFEARGVMLVNPERGEQKAITPPRSLQSKIQERMAELAELDRAKAIERQAELAARVETKN